MSTLRDETPAWLLAAQILAILALVPLLLLAPVLAGALAAAILLLGWARVVPELLIAARPLWFPLLAVALAGALGDGLAPGTRLLVGLLVGLVAVPWAASGWVRRGTVRRDTGRTLRSLAVALGVSLVLVGVALALFALVDDTRAWVGGSVLSFDELGGVPITIALCAMVVWALAIACRAFGFMASPVRVLLGLALLLLVARALTEAALFPEVALLPEADALLLAAGAALGLAALVERIADARVASPPAWVRAAQAPACWLAATGKGEAWRARWLAAGLGMAIASTIVLVVALVWGAAEVRRGQDAVARGHDRGGERPARPIAAMTDAQLAAAFAPVLQFSEDQRWLPQRVDAYVAQADLRPPRPEGVAEGELPTSCPPGRTDPCYRLDCPTAEDPCARSEDHTGRRGRSREGTAYVRVVRRDRPLVGAAPGFAERLPRAFDRRIQPYGERLSILVQYWLFYPYDEWVAPVLAGRLVQRHAGDWEAVTVGLSDEEPLFVAYSQHCGGRWAPWERVLVAERPRPRTHPLVGVAVGSQANYERPRDVRSPNWTTCSGLPETSIDLLSYVWNIRDRTADDFELLPADLVPARADEPPMSFPGRWGASDATEFVGFATRRLDSGNGPRTPPGQPLWSDPVRQIFCGGAWRGPATPPCPVRRS